MGDPRTHGIEDGSTPDSICRVCAAVPQVSGAAIASMTDAHHQDTIAASDRVAEQLQDLQFELGEGPSVQALTDGRAMLVEDLRGVPDHRWPMFAHAAAGTPARAVFCFPLQLGAVGVGVLELYRDRTGPLTPPQMARAWGCAELALCALIRREKNGLRLAEHDRAGPDWLTARGRVRAQVYQATGMVMGQLGLPPAAALARLRAYAYGRSRNLDAVASDVMSGRLWFPTADDQ